MEVISHDRFNLTDYAMYFECDQLKMTDLTLSMTD